ncbi:tetratricopeptide repeat protein [Roseivirga pacifica]|uniref:tetratricopeptide repeat protein n=1 Tax=Roseivirga pacifica TaxID=1267423 RepID=UPI003BAF9113
MKKYIFSIAILFTALGSLVAQNTFQQEDENRLFRFGLELLDKQKYSAAREQFERFLDSGTDKVKMTEAEYYVAFCALNLDNADGPDLIAKFVDKHPNNPKAAKAYYQLGIIAFKSADYTNAGSYLKKAKFSALNEQEVAEAYFKIAYSAYYLGSTQEAVEYFDLAKRENSEYYAEANYYSGYLAYYEKNYDKAIVDLKRAGESDKYKYRIPVMLTGSYFQQGRYGEVLSYVNKFKDVQLELTRTDYLYQLYQMAAESAFALQRYDDAIEFYGLYRQTAGETISDQTLYRIGYSHYAVGDNQEAIENFKRVALQEDTLSQYASYYLGQLYVQDQNFLFAASAFDQASKLPYNKEIQEEASFNFAKVNYSTQKYSVAITSLDRFIGQFPNSPYIPEANNLLSEAFLNTNDFSRAITFIERIENKTPRVKEAYQKVTFFKGTEHFNAGQYDQAVKLFDKSLTYTTDRDIQTASLFWKAEALATMRQYDRAKQAYQRVFQTRNRESEYYTKANYGLGYAYYNTRDYQNARIYFKRYVDVLESAQNRMNYDDAILRLADCYYVDKEYATAIAYYDRAIQNNNPNVDYAYFQKGVVRDFQERSEEAIKELEVVINRYSNSIYYDDAIYKKAQIQLENKDYRESIVGFTRIIENQKQSLFIPYAYESRALAYFNLKELDRAEADYKTILDNYVTSRVANSALLGLQNTLKLNEKVLEFDQYLSKYKSANPENEALENIELESAKNLYFGQEYEAAIGAFAAYERNYPESPLRHQAKFYRAESMFRLNQVDQALALYYELDRESQINDMDVVFQRIGQLQLRKGDFTEAANYFTKLESISRSKRQENDAWAGLLEAYFKLSDFEKMRVYANNIIEKGNVSADATNKAQLYLAKASIAEGNFQAAIDELLTTVNTSTDVYGAEAQYLLGEIFYKQTQYQQSLNTLFDFNDKYSGYDQWLGKAFLLIADNYIALNELFQAKATVNSIIEYSEVEDVVTQAKAKLVEIERLEEMQKQQEVADTTQIKGGNE